jgi:RNA polymerase sigma-32 factor
LIEAQLRLVVKIAHEYWWSGQDIQDLIQAGNLGLVIAFEKFDPGRGVRLSTYAAFWIRAYVRACAAASLRLVRGGPSSPDLSLDSTLSADGGSHLDLLPAEDASRPDVALEAKEHRAVVNRAIEQFAAGLQGRDRLIFRKRFLVESPLTLDGLGRRLGVSRERVRQLERRVLDRLRAFLADSLGEPADELQAAA